VSHVLSSSLSRLSWSSFVVDCDDYLKNPTVQSICEIVAKCVAVAGLVSVVAGVVFSSIPLGVPGFLGFALSATNYLYIAGYGRLYTELTILKVSEDSATRARKAAEDQVRALTTLQESAIRLETQISALKSANAEGDRLRSEIDGENHELSSTVEILEAALKHAAAQTSQLQAAAALAQQAAGETTSAAGAIADALEDALDDGVAPSWRPISVREAIVADKLELADKTGDVLTRVATAASVAQELSALSEEDRALLFAKCPSLRQLIGGQ